MAVNQPKKKQSLRNNEYYNTQEIFDDLYEKSQHGEVFTHLMELITSEQNTLKKDGLKSMSCKRQLIL